MYSGHVADLDVETLEDVIQMFGDSHVYNFENNSYHPILNNPSEMLDFSRRLIEFPNQHITDSSNSSSQQDDVSSYDNASDYSLDYERYLNIIDDFSDSFDNVQESNYSDEMMHDGISLENDEMIHDGRSNNHSSLFRNVFHLYSAISNYDSDPFFERELQEVLEILNISDDTNPNIEEFLLEFNIPNQSNSDDNVELLRSRMMYFLSHSELLNNIYEGVVGDSLNEPIRKEPLPNEILETLPVKTIDDKIINELESCVICADNYLLEERILLLPCKHIFHTFCIKRWFEEKSTCPICRKLVENNSKDEFKFPIES